VWSNVPKIVVYNQLCCLIYALRLPSSPLSFITDIPIKSLHSPSLFSSLKLQTCWKLLIEVPSGALVRTQWCILWFKITEGFVLWVSGLWYRVFWQVWTNLNCKVVRYDTLDTDDCGPVYFVILWVVTLCIRTSVDQFILWDCGLWHSVKWLVWTSLFCDIVGYDTVYKDKCGPVYFVRLWVMTFCIMTSVDQFILWDCGLWHCV